MKKFWVDALYILVILALFLTLIFGFKFITSETKDCVQQPFVYGAKKTAGATSCQCYSITDDERVDFKFNETSFELIKQEWINPYE